MCGAKSTTLKVGFIEDNPLPPSHSLDNPYHISQDQCWHVDLTSLLTLNHNDPTYKGFYHDLIGHILSQLTG
ncbi:hypothetical protein QCA50_009198 [Cerrena zonata]|uniref:Uncharacterized protein n=1 Tax=Cerrena zonata TaxID=2478898 RepID=A0AAW0G9F1_9APHY